MSSAGLAAERSHAGCSSGPIEVDGHGVGDLVGELLGVAAGGAAGRALKTNAWEYAEIEYEGYQLRSANSSSVAHSICGRFLRLLDR